MQVTIEVCYRPLTYYSATWTYHACIAGEPGYWGCGRTMDEAVGSLVRSHPERFGVTMKFLDGVTR